MTPQYDRGESLSMAVQMYDDISTCMPSRFLQIFGGSFEARWRAHSWGKGSDVVNISLIGQTGYCAIYPLVGLLHEKTSPKLGKNTTREKVWPVWGGYVWIAGWSLFQRQNDSGISQVDLEMSLGHKTDSLFAYRRMTCSSYYNGLF
ncbi:hypothetical protein CGRA01v4_14215 [Colletotrichum graminicola]|nr:hypothetical protein CGRA01v4_14215 [Colletotrichum graminicola]